MNYLIGFILVVASVLGGFTLMGGNVLVLWNPFELLVVGGAALGAYVIANSRSVLRDTLSSLGALFRGQPYTKDDYLELLSLLYMVFRTGRQNLMSMEPDLDNPEKSAFFQKFPKVARNRRNLRFLCDYMRLILLGSDRAHELEALIDEEIETIERELVRVPKALNVMAESLPALGIVAAVLGVIKAMGAIAEPPQVLGRLIGGALTGTFMGVLLSYGFVGPLAGAIRERREHEINYYICIKAGLMAYMNGYPPQICVEYARKVLSQDIRPDFAEVESATQRAAGTLGVRTA